MDNRLVLDTLKGVSITNPAAAAPVQPQNHFTPSAIDEFVTLMGGEHVWHDRAGWPLAISRGMFRKADGRFISECAITPAELASLLQQASIIGEYFDRQRSGEMRMTRRYVATITGRVLVCDIGRHGWRAFIAASEADAALPLRNIVRPAQ